MIPDEVFERRADLFELHAEVETALDEIARRHLVGPTQATTDAYAFLAACRAEIVDEYLTLVPYRAISRCPFTGLSVVYPIDDMGLDGLWWRFHEPERPTADLVPTVYAVMGAVNLDGGVEDTPFLVKPGPGAPFVLPRLLEDEWTTAVVSSATIGSHDGYAIVYFSDRTLSYGAAAAEWGTNTWTLRPPQGGAASVSITELDVERDFDLAPWIESGRLLWIRPGDESLELKSGLEGCPYVGLPGLRREVRLEDGVIR